MLIAVFSLFLAFGSGIVIGRVVGLRQGWANAVKAFDTAYLAAIGYTVQGPTK